MQISSLFRRAHRQSKLLQFYPSMTKAENSTGFAATGQQKADLVALMPRGIRVRQRIPVKAANRIPLPFPPPAKPGEGSAS